MCRLQNKQRTGQTILLAEHHDNGGMHAACVRVHIGSTEGEMSSQDKERTSTQQPSAPSPLSQRMKGERTHGV